MKKIISLILAIVTVMSMSLTAFAANNQTEISLTLDESMESYELVIPATVTIDPAEKTGKVEVKIQNINLVWNKGINLYVKAANDDPDADVSSYLINTEEPNKKIGYKLHLSSSIVYYADNRLYDAEIGLLSNVYRAQDTSEIRALYAEEVNLVIHGDYPGSGTYTDTLTFTVVPGEPEL